MLWGQQLDLDTLQPMRVLILSSSTGGGHDMRAKSFVQWAELDKMKSYGIETFRYQGLEETSKLYGFGVGFYNLIQKKWPQLHHLYFNFLELFQISAHKRLLLGKAHYIQALQAFRPDLILSVHAHLNHAFREIAKDTLPKVKFVTYCGEMFGGYGFSRHWVDPGADAFIGATKEICQAAIKLKMPNDQVLHGGFLLNPKFYQAQLNDSAKEALRTKLQLAANQFTLLLSTGANGALNHLSFIQALDRAGLSLQVIALCGKNAAALEQINTWQSSSGKITVRALGYRDDMFELMQISDAIVARPGTGTTSESIMAACPILLNTLGGVMPQEWITVKYLRAQGLAAKRIKQSKDLVPQVTELIHQSEQQQMARRAQMQDLQPQLHPKDIIEYLTHLQSGKA